VKYLFAAIVALISTAALASPDEVRIPWKGDYAHNSSKTWSRDNPYDSGFSKNFLNGAPEEGGKVQKDGELGAEVLLPENTTGPIPFALVLHGGFGLDKLTSEWAHRVAKTLNDEGIGALILDSYTLRQVKNTAGLPDLHWGRRRADDAYSALDYLIEHKLAKPDEVYLIGLSNGGLTTLTALSKKEDDHKYKFAAGFPIVPACINPKVRDGDYIRPMIVFIGENDDANEPKYCIEMLKKKRASPMQLVILKNADHGFALKFPHPLVIKGWVDSHGVQHDWHLSYNPVAEKDMMQTIISALKTKKFVKGIDVRPTKTEAAQK
jgi:dienelactone hydrolase